MIAHWKLASSAFSECRNSSAIAAPRWTRGSRHKSLRLFLFVSFYFSFFCMARDREVELFFSASPRYLSLFRWFILFEVQNVLLVLFRVPPTPSSCYSGWTLHAFLVVSDRTRSYNPRSRKRSPSWIRPRVCVLYVRQERAMGSIVTIYPRDGGHRLLVRSLSHAQYNTPIIPFG